MLWTALRLGALGLAALVGWAVGGLYPNTASALRPLWEELPWVERGVPPIYVATLVRDREYAVTWQPVQGGRKVQRVRYRVMDERGEVLREESLPPDARLFLFPRDPAWYPPESSCDREAARLRTRLALRLWLVYGGEAGSATSAVAEQILVVDYTAPVLDVGRVGFQVDPQGPQAGDPRPVYSLRLHVAACDNLTPGDQVLYRFAVWPELAAQPLQNAQGWRPVSEQALIPVPAGRYRLDVELQDGVGNTTSYVGARSVGVFDETGSLRLNEALGRPAS